MRMALRTPSASASAMRIGCATVRNVVIENLEHERRGDVIPSNAGRLKGVFRGSLRITVHTAEHGGTGTIVLHDRRSEKCHRGVADEFVERPAVREDRFHRAREKVR